MVQANNAIAALTSRRNFLQSGSAAIAAGAALALPTAAIAETEALEGKPLTAEFCASLEFEPWVDSQQPPTNEQWIKAINPYLVSARIAWATCQKTKPELVKVIDDLGEDEEVWDEFYRGFKDAQAFFQYFHDLFKVAESRIICAGSVIELREEGEAYSKAAGTGGSQ